MVKEISKENGTENTISLEEALVRLKNYYGCDVKTTLLQIGLMQTSFFYYEFIGGKANER